MKAAFIGDIHANLPALEAVLKDIGDRRIGKIWQTGDIVGYGTSPEEVVQLLRRKGIAGIIGNYDQKALLAGDPESERLPKRALKRLAYRWAWEHLSEDSRRWLAALPTQRRLTFGGKRVLICHGSPESVEKYIGPETPPERLTELAEKAQTDVVVCGHTHRPFIAKALGTLFVNAGSVGRSGDGDPRACYAILEVAGGSVGAKNVRVAYDVQRTAEDIRGAGLPEEFAQMILQATDLDGVERAAAEKGGQEAPNPPSKKSFSGEARSEPDRRALERPAGQRVPPADLPEAAARFAESLGQEVGHARHVTALALKLFDDLRPLHGYGAHARFLLECAGILHDIGWVKGQKGHHKESMRMILGAEELPFSPADRRIVASAARYHRRALPKAGHRRFAELSAPERDKVRWLAALLRLADGLDCNHLGRVTGVDARWTGDAIRLRVSVAGPAVEEISEAGEKADLLRQQSGREVAMEAADR